MEKVGGGEGAPGDRGKTLRGYIARRKATVAEWVFLLPILNFCVKETGFEDGGGAQEQWWCQTNLERQMKNKLKEISVAARERRQQKFGRRG